MLTWLVEDGVIDVRHGESVDAVQAEAPMREIASQASGSESSPQ
jgi:hypothetical protein